MRTRLIGLGLVLVAAVGACGGNDGDDASDGNRPEDVAAVLAEVKGLDLEARTARLLELTKAEGGKLSFYTSMNPDNADAVVKAFEKAFPVDVSLFRADSETIAQRVSSEGDAGRAGADVIEANGLILSSIDAGKFAAYTSPVQDDLIPEARKGHWTADQLDVFVLTWNTDLVKASERPTSWEDLADPRWKGRLALEPGDVEWYAALRDHWLQQGKSAEEADRLFAAIGANARAVKGHTLMTQLLASGEFDVAASPFLNRVRQLAADGAPIAYEPVVEPLIATASGVALPRGTKHPAASVLFADWLLGDGQEEIAKLDTVVTRADLQDSGGATIIHADLEKLAADYDGWEMRYEKVLEGAEVVEEKD